MFKTYKIVFKLCFFFLLVMKNNLTNKRNNLFYYACIEGLFLKSETLKAKYFFCSKDLVCFHLIHASETNGNCIFFSTLIKCILNVFESYIVFFFFFTFYTSVALWFLVCVIFVIISFFLMKNMKCFVFFSFCDRPACCQCTIPLSP